MNILEKRVSKYGRLTIVFTIDIGNRDKEKSSGQTHCIGSVFELYKLWTEPQVNPMSR
jgi:hypothetical protein